LGLGSDIAHHVIQRISYAQFLESDDILQYDVASITRQALLKIEGLGFRV
jgi:hypothetical protein